MALDFAPGIYHGVLVQVVEDEGTGLVGDYLAGATVLTVGSGGALDLAGTCRIAGTDYAYTRDGETVTITPGLAAAAEDGDPVVSLGADGLPDTRKQAVVDLDMTGDEDEELPHAWIPGELSGFYPLGSGAAGAQVDVVDTDDGYRVVGQPHGAPSLTGSASDAGNYAQCFPTGANQSVPPGTWVTIDDSVGMLPGGDFITGPGGGVVTIARDGWYIVDLQVTWAADPTGDRRVRVINHASSDLVIAQDHREAAGGTHVHMHVLDRFNAGDQVRVEVRQSSGANLDLLSSDILATGEIATRWTMRRSF